MALNKSIILDNGITVNYHRIVSVNNITNKSSIIEIASYTSKEKRNQEKEKIENGEPMNIYTNTQYLNIGYVKDLNVDSAYERIKAMDMFNGSTDDI